LARHDGKEFQQCYRVSPITATERWEEAKRHLSEVLRLDPGNREAKQTLAKIAALAPLD